MRLVVPILGFGLVLSLQAVLATPGSAATIIFACGQDVPSHEEGSLIANLDCGTSGIGVHLGQRSRLRLNGHTITGGTFGVLTHAGKTEIEGPGAIVGATEVGIAAPNNEGRHQLRIRDGVELSGHGIAAIALGQGNTVKLVLEDVAIHDNPGSGTADCSGVRIKATDVTVSRNATGICADGIVLKRTQIQDNVGVGIFSWRARPRLKDSVVTGNDAAGNGWDIETTYKPNLFGTSSCGHSVVMPKFPGLPTPASPSWGVCAND
jgi:hypothetical protein